MNTLEYMSYLDCGSKQSRDILGLLRTLIVNKKILQKREKRTKLSCQKNNEKCEEKKTVTITFSVYRQMMKHNLSGNTY